MCLVISLCDETGIKFIGKESLFIRGLIHKENFPKLQAKKNKKQKKKRTEKKTVVLNKMTRLREQEKVD